MKLQKIVQQRTDGSWIVFVLLPDIDDKNPKVAKNLISIGKTREEAEKKWEDEHGANRKIYEIED